MRISHYICLFFLITVSGVCSNYSKNIFKRGGNYLILGFLITLISAFFMPEELIVFGIISFFGVSMILFGSIKKYYMKIPWLISMALVLILYIPNINFTNNNYFQILIFILEMTNFKL